MRRASTVGAAPKKQVVHEISIKNITADSELQPRSAIDYDVVREYSDAMMEGAEFPPLTVYFDGITYWLADGFHRHRAAIKAGKPSVLCVVYQGDKDAAILASVGANAEHGVRRKPEDKKRVVLRMLNHPIWCHWADAEIARKCHVSASTVSRYRENSPGLLGHNVTMRVDKNGNLNSHATSKSPEPPETIVDPAYEMPRTPLTKSELDDQYARKIVRALKKQDADLATRVYTPFGVVDAMDKTRAYILATAADRHVMFATIGRAFLMSQHLGKTPTIIGHFPRSVAPIIAEAIKYGFVICSPQGLIAESEGRS